MGRKRISFLSGNIKEEARELRDLYQANQETETDFFRFLRNSYKKELEWHSYSLKLERDLYHGKKSSVRRRRAKKSFEQALNLCRENIDKLYPHLDISFLEDLGIILDPDKNLLGFRRFETSRTTIQSSSYSPPSGEKVMRELCFFIGMYGNLDDPLDKALFAHLHIARIHPFRDGNGRVSRLVQDLILEREGFLPLTIPLNERERYLDKIEKASISYRNSIGLLDRRTFEKYKQISEKIDSASRSGVDPFSIYSLFIDLGGEELSKLLLKKTNTPEQRKFYDFLLFKLIGTLECIMRKKR